MLYLITFLEGLITFVSPCLLPMLPIYISYFTGDEGHKGTALKGALGFVLGFTGVFVLLGAFAGTVGALLLRYQAVVNVVTGFVVICFGLSYLGVFHITFFRGFGSNGNVRNASGGFLRAILFGIVFSIGWTPCVGAFLGSALMLASQQGSTFQGILLLLLFSLGLGIPFVVSAVLIERLKSAFAFIKRHYGIITTVSGCLLIALGIAMMTGMLGRLLTIISI